MDNAEEFRFVFKDEKEFSMYKSSKNNIYNMDDYYLSRDQRIRYFSKHKNKIGKYFLITAEPGKIVKQETEIESDIANKLIPESVLVIRKEGIQRVVVNGLEGYAEKVKGYSPSKINPFLEEIHIEFELSRKELSSLKKEMHPWKVIKTGLFDYIYKKTSHPKFAKL